jgi:hypothetical protein
VPAYRQRHTSASDLSPPIPALIFGSPAYRPEKFVEALRNSPTETERLRQENRRLAAARREPIAVVAIH